MKKIKVLLLLLVSLAVFGVNSFAAGYTGDGIFYFEDETISYEGESATINVYLDTTKATSFGADSYIKFTLGSGLSYDLSANEALGTGTYATKSYWTEEDGCLQWVASSDITAETALFCTFVVNVDDPNGDLTVSFTEDTCLYDPIEGTEYMGDTSVVLTLVPASGEDKTEATIGATGDVTFEYAEGDSASSALAGKRVVLDTAGNKVSGNLKDKKVAVTYTEAGSDPIVKTFGETLNELLGLDGDGSTTANVRFGIVCDSSLTGTFTFAIVD